MSAAPPAGLQQALPSLQLLLNGLAGRELRLQPCAPAAREGPPARAILTRGHLLLPDGAPGYRLYRAAVAHAVAHLRHSPFQQPVAGLKPMGLAVVSAIEDARAEALLMRELPGVRSWFMEFLCRGTDASDLSFESFIARLARALIDPVYQDGNYWIDKARRLFTDATRAHGLQDGAAFRKVASLLANDLGQMRVRFDLQRYAVPAPYRDDNSALWDFGDPVDVPPQIQSLQVKGAAIDYQPREVTPADAADAEPLDSAEEQELGRHSHAEWDYRLEHSRPDWCTVIEKRPAWRNARRPQAAALAALPVLAWPRARRLSRTRRLRRQWEGDDIDLNAAIEVLTERRLKLAPEPRLFMRPGREARSTSMLVLLDLSESANDRLGGAARSLLDLEKQAALLLAQSLAAGPDRIAIDGFSSNTRAEVSYFRLLDFDEGLNPATAGMIGAAQAAFSTRMGAALRHAALRLRDEAAEQRAIVIVTDGAPSDVDVFDARYLIEDARAAVLEARRAGIACCCIAVDPQADAYVKTIFGWRNYRIVDAPETLPAQLSDLYARLAVR
jgi:nitric oxide reductase NorD protein